MQGAGMAKARHLWVQAAPSALGGCLSSYMQVRERRD